MTNTIASRISALALIIALVICAGIPAAHARPALAGIADAFDFPVGYPNGQGYNTTAGYGFLQVGAQGIHPGEDWNKNCAGDCDLNDPVYAAANGHIVATGYYRTWGNIILIQHVLPDGSSVWTQYAHLNAILVSSGDVTRGQQIGTIGKGDGNQYFAHLHFEVRTRSLPADWWPASNGWDRATVLQYYTEPTAFVRSHRTTAVIPPPQRTSPGDSAHISGRTVTFQWQTPAVADLKGYTLRVTDQPNLDAQPWLVDTGVGKENTRFDATLPSGVEGRTLYWGMKTLTNSGQTSGWTPVWSLIIDRPRASDTTAPALDSWSFDPADAAGGGAVTIHASGSDGDSGVRQIDFWYNNAHDGSLNGSWIALGSALSQPPAANFSGETRWDVSGLPEGRYRVGIDLTDGAGNKIDAGTRRGITYVVDRTPPNGRITAPAPGAVLTSHTISIAAEVDDSLSGIGSVQFFVSTSQGWQYIGADVDGTDGWQLGWDASAQADGTPFSLAIVPIDRAGNWTSSSVDNLVIQTGGAASTPVLQGVYVHDSQGNDQGIFQPGDPIQLGIYGTVQGGDAVSASLWWRVTDRQGLVVGALSYADFPATLDQNGWNYLLPTNVPTDLAPGDYTFTGELHFGGQTQQLRAAFTVGALPPGWAPDQWQSVSVFTLDRSIAHGGGRSARITSMTENDARWTQHVAVRPNASYVLSGWIRTENVRSDVIGASLGLVDDWTRTTDLRGTQGWTYVEVTIDTGTRSDLWIGCRLGHWSNTTTGTAWFDDLTLRQKTSAGLGANLLLNPGFED
jgi:murein DD-endopeptidase MepM/ murein hydrolase activator NlpD